MKHAREDYNRIQDPSGKIPKDEPVFLIRGQDINAPYAIEVWADLAERNGAAPKIVQMARDHADLVANWQANNDIAKIPDLPDEG